MKEYTEKDLVNFGNYVLSKQRKSKIKHKRNVNLVHDGDVDYFKNHDKIK